MEELLTYERSLFLWINRTHAPFPDAVMWAFSGIYIWCPLLMVPLYFGLRRRKDRIPAVLSVGLVTLLCSVVPAWLFKPLFARFRPTAHPLFMDCVTLLHNYRADGDYGFISGHATMAFGFALLSLLLVRNGIYTVAILLWAFMMAYSRVYLGAHFVSDVIAGMGVGALLGWFVYRLYTYTVKRYFHTNSFNNTFR
ncbi:MAG: phosphatase PAP2 family protein [Tannerella sp.]|jgi:undecaprenyl-diphosphatase|nr:phosphatase PAP2 family protein [Tannerella sp.]